MEIDNPWLPLKLHLSLTIGFMRDTPGISFLPHRNSGLIAIPGREQPMPSWTEADMNYYFASPQFEEDYGSEAKIRAATAKATSLSGDIWKLIRGK